MSDVKEQFARLTEAHNFLIPTDEQKADPVQAVARYEALVREGNVPAMLRLAVHAAEGLGREKNWNEALDLLVLAAERSPPGGSAIRQLRLIAGQSAEPSSRRLRDGIDLEALFTPPPFERLSEKSMVAAVRGLGPAGFSEWLIGRATDKLAPSLIDVMSTGETVLSPLRTATHAVFGALARDLIFSVMEERVSRLWSIPIPCHEAPSIISYEPGQHFAPHHDWVPPELLKTQEKFRERGQRVATVVTYLNDDFEGGPTRFPLLGVEFRGRPGDAIVFSNVLPNGEPDLLTVHEGAPVQSGRKWVLSQWLRLQPQPLYG